MADLGVAFAAGLGAERADADEEPPVLNALGPFVATFPRTAVGNTPPPRLLAGPAAALSAPVGIAFDPVHDEIVVINATTQTASAYPRTASGPVVPLRTLGGRTTGLVGPLTAAVDPFHDELVVANGFGQSITVHARTASGGDAPLRTLAGPSTGLAGPYGVALDLVHGELFVTNMTSASVAAFARTASGNAAPLRVLAGPSTGLAGPRGVAVDTVHGEFAVANISDDSVTVYARGASDDTAPLRTLRGPSTGLDLPVSVAIDTVHDELIVTDATVVRVFARTAAGDAAPLRTIAGPDTALVTPAAVALAAEAPLVAAVLPGSRSVELGTPATAFATIINAGPGPASACGVAPITPLAASFFFQTTEPVGNTPVGAPNAPVDIPAGGAQTYVFAVQPIAPLAPTDVHLGFACAGVAAAPIVSGLDTLLLSASTTPVPDVIAQSATIGNTGIVDLPGPSGSGAFAVATSNVGAAGSITARADTGDAPLPVALSICRTDSATGACLAAPAASVTLDVPSGGTPSFGVFATATSPIPFDPSVNRVVVRFTEGGVSRGATSVAIRTP